MTKYIFCDTDTDVFSQFQRAFQKRGDSIVYNGKFTDFLKYDLKNLAIICPITSLGFIDKQFTEEFPLLPKFLIDQIQSHGNTNLSNKRFIEIGSAISILYNEETQLRILCTCTTYTPQDTENIFYAFLAAKNLVQKINTKYPGAISTVLCPALTNEIEPMYMIDQMDKAMKSVRYRDLRVNVPYFYSNNDASKDQEINEENEEFILAS